MTNFKEKLAHVKAFAFDVDGVFSNASIYLHPTGELMRSMNIKDGFAINYIIRKGYPVAIITGGDTESVRVRFEKLGVKDIYMRSRNKIVDFEDFLARRGLKAAEVLYMGDDLPDYEVMKQVGVPVCPADAADEIKGVAMYISDRDGGSGCVRDVIEQVLRVQGKWLEPDAFIW
jgi:3-deoxy-D-manno-octulosonate 8-phosphate phosphatase (KDO 8-P phosphatase)